MTRRTSSRNRVRRGTALAAFIGALVVVQLLVIAVAVRATHDAELTARASEGMQALYAAEGGLNLAYREIALGVDEDGDGVIGGVSDDGDPDTDPLIGPGSASVAVLAQSLSARGRSGLSRRSLGVEILASGGGGNGNGGGNNGNGNGNGNGSGNNGNGNGNAGGNNGNGNGNGGGNGTGNEGNGNGNSGNGNGNGGGNGTGNEGNGNGGGNGNGNGGGNGTGNEGNGNGGGNGDDDEDGGSGGGGWLAWLLDLLRRLLGGG
ncbi:MAG: hypothetical protein ACF8R7_03415 [Phycisphaerales bacterium JB039]